MGGELLKWKFSQSSWGNCYSCPVVNSASWSQEPNEKCPAMDHGPGSGALLGIGVRKLALASALDGFWQQIRGRTLADRSAFMSLCCFSVIWNSGSLEFCRRNPSIWWSLTSEISWKIQGSHTGNRAFWASKQKFSNWHKQFLFSTLSPHAPHLLTKDLLSFSPCSAN